MDRNAILKQMGITQWLLRDSSGVQSPAAKEPGVKSPQPVESGKPAGGKLEKAPVAAEQLAAPVQPQKLPEVATLAALRGQVAACNACELAATRTHTVFGEGPEQADWMFVGEAPGQQEDVQGKPFVGRAGSLLTQMVSAIDRSREQVFIANTLKCRPPNNRNPLPVELSACEHFLLRQIELVRPKVMVALGRYAAQALLRQDQPLGRLRGQVYQYGPDKIPLVVTYHPAYLLRNPAEKGKVWEDLLLASRQIPV